MGKLFVVFVLLSSLASLNANVLKYESRRHPNDVTYDDANIARVGSVAPPRVIGPDNPDGMDKLPKNVTRRVLVIGGGLAGMSAALELAERGYDVTIREASNALGGRFASRTVKVGDDKFSVDNSFISWMSNNYQFLDVANRLNLTNEKFAKWTQIDYFFKGYKPVSMKNPPYSYPFDIMNLLWNDKNINFGNVVKTVFEAGNFVNFDYGQVYQKFDNITFADWVKREGIPKSFYDNFLLPIVWELKNDNMTISAAEMFKYFYLYYLSTTPTAQTNRLVTGLGNKGSLIGPFQSYLKSKGVKIELSKSFNSFNFDSSGRYVTGDLRLQEHFDYCVLATGSKQARKILTLTRNEFSGLLPAVKALDFILKSVNNVKSAPPYATVRLWLDKSTESSRPPVIFTPDFSPMHAVVLYHLFQSESMQWARKHNGSVIELQLTETGDLEIPLYLQMTCAVLPELCNQNATIVAKTKKVFTDSPGLEKGQSYYKPKVNSTAEAGIRNLFLAGDWLKIMYPAAIGEAALDTGREAANQILYADHVRQVSLTVSSNHGPGWL